MTRVGWVDPGWGVGCPAVESSQFCAGHPGSTGSTRVWVIPEGTGLSWFGRVNPVRPGSDRVGRVIPAQPGSTQIGRVNPSPLGHLPSRSGPDSHANPFFFSVHLKPGTPGSNPMVNPHRNPGQPVKTRFDPIFSRLLSCTRSSVDTRRENRRLQTDPQWRSTVDSLAFRLPMHAKILALCSPSEVRVLSLTVTSHAVTLIRVSARTHGRMDAQAHHGSVQ